MSDLEGWKKATIPLPIWAARDATPDHFQRQLVPCFYCGGRWVWAMEVVRRKRSTVFLFQPRAPPRHQNGAAVFNAGHQFLEDAHVTCQYSANGNRVR